MAGGRRTGGSIAAGSFGPEPVVPTPTLTGTPVADALRFTTIVPAPGTWINQQQLIDGPRNVLFRPLMLDPTNRCFQAWRAAGRGGVNCP